MKSMIVIPHCQSEHHVSGMAGGWTDWPLTELGRKQAERVGRALSDYPNIREYSVFTSDLLRSLQTAEISGGIVGFVPERITDFREIDIGQGTGQSVEWLNRNTIPLTGSRLTYRSLPGAESRLDVMARIYAKLDKLQSEGVENMLIFTHGYAATMFIAWWLKLPSEALEHAHFQTPSGSITELSVHDTGLRILKKLGDTNHLQFTG